MPERTAWRSIATIQLETVQERKIIGHAFPQVSELGFITSSQLRKVCSICVQEHTFFGHAWRSNRKLGDCWERLKAGNARTIIRLVIIGILFLEICWTSHWGWTSSFYVV
eukprot:gb/GEZJ01004955.1/.p2 GENE.gb/GEZJ01004955.1/~~gb/GEZJ01004955.1/.p2  ORF type:complete len:110 (-),score=5.74 gb/GEZJ01004955.1/:823-1152(-)